MATPYQALMPIFAAEVFRGDARMLGFLIGAAGFRRIERPHLPRRAQGCARLALHIVIGAALAGVSLMVFAESKLLWLSLIAIMLTGSASFSSSWAPA